MALLWWLVIVGVVAVLLGVLGLPFFRAHALEGRQASLTVHSSEYNLIFSCYDHFGEGGLRVMLYPKYLNVKPTRRTWPGSGHVENMAGNYSAWRENSAAYGGSRIEFPPGKNAAIMSPDGQVSFVTFAPRHFHFGPTKVSRKWGFTARKRFPVDLNFR